MKLKLILKLKQSFLKFGQFCKEIKMKKFSSWIFLKYYAQFKDIIIPYVSKKQPKVLLVY